ncbi:hypothetical protein [Bradyrhizobium sp. 187]|uniref:hypothetical protein n=1 Tax=Bradyrhizobium sp. 187 TaxID=2782655 RepID=UPI001FFE9841|nr:hypothetical protein [Bradyrhizobium sp. 187]UPJ71837.1 hypothetical protein IVB19_30175 [Bradyrhizobium sp. 187]
MTKTAQVDTNNPRRNWPIELQEEFDATNLSGVVGTVLVSETDKLRVWHLRLPPGKRCGFHRHQIDYFWTALTCGRARGYYDDGRIEDVAHFVGETKHFRFGPGESFTHSVENIGDTDLLFATVEFLESSNPPLPVPDSVRLKPALKQGN